VNCEEARQAISARLDQEPAGVETSELDRHIAGCRACQVWRDGAHELTRKVRLQPVRPAPGPTERLFAAVRGERRQRWWDPRSMTAARAGLVVAAGAQLALCVPVLLFGHDRSAPVHVAHEMGSFEVAVAIGFLVAARRPGRAMGMLSLIGVAAGLLVLTAVLDLLAGRTSLADEAPHLIVVAGWLLLRRLASVAPPTWERPHTALATLSAGWAAVTGRRPRLMRVGSRLTRAADRPAALAGDTV
jgi:predicted anti-sigma-YlaC factor YlaD